ncbi:MAG TPA: VC0807 family protein [Caulobacteraceae bacterium]|nr:VC0807 family protein [Caulobacteraceae bacterium]
MTDTSSLPPCDAAPQPAARTLPARGLADRALAWVRANGLRTAAEVVVNFALPMLAYDFAKPHLGDTGALMAASAPPLCWTILEFARRRRVDALSLLVLTGIALSLLAFFGGGGVRVLQLREHLVTALVGLIFLGSLAIGRPLIYHLARARVRRVSPAELQRLESIQGSDVFRRTMTLLTLAWGIGLVAESALACALVFTLSIPQFLVVSPILGTGVTLALTAWTFWYAYRRLAPVARAAQADRD